MGIAKPHVAVRSSRRLSVQLAVTFFWITTVMSSAQAQTPAYSYKDLSAAFPADVILNPSYIALALNNVGQIGGTYYTSTGRGPKLFIMNIDGSGFREFPMPVVDYGALYFVGFNNLGEIVLCCEQNLAPPLASSRFIVVRPDGTLTKSAESIMLQEVWAINKAGQVGGLVAEKCPWDTTDYGPTYCMHLALMNTSGGLILEGPPQGECRPPFEEDKYTDDIAALNNVGQVTGMLTKAYGCLLVYRHAFIGSITAAPGSVVDLDPGGVDMSSGAAINNRGQVVIQAYRGGFGYSYYVWDGVTFRQFPPDCYPATWRGLINDAGQILAYCSQKLTILQMRETGFSQEVELRVPGASSGHTVPFEMNEKGQVVGLGVFYPNTHFGVFLATPTITVDLNASTPALVGKTITVTMTVKNNTNGPLTAVTPSALTVRAGDEDKVQFVSGPDPKATAFLGPKDEAKFTYVYLAKKIGKVVFSGQAQAKDAFLTPISSPQVTSNEVEIEGPLAVTLKAAPPRLPPGKAITVTVTATNRGDTRLTDVTPSALTVGGDGGVTPVPPGTPTPNKFDLEPEGMPGSKKIFTFTYTATKVGNVGFSGSASAIDSGTGLPVISKKADSFPPLTTISPLEAKLVPSVPSDESVKVNDTFTLTLTAINKGATVLTKVQPGTLLIEKVPGEAEYLVPPAFTPVDLPACLGEPCPSHDFVYALKATKGGKVVFLGVAIATESASGTELKEGAGAEVAVGLTILGTVFDVSLAAPTDRNGRLGTVVEDRNRYRTLPDLEVVAEDASGNKFRGTTGSDGKYLITVPGEGTYRVSVVDPDTRVGARHTQVTLRAFEGFVKQDIQLPVSLLKDAMRLRDELQNLEVPLVDVEYAALTILHATGLLKPLRFRYNVLDLSDFLLQFRLAEETPLYQGVYTGQDRAPDSWDALQRLVVTLAFFERRFEESQRFAYLTVRGVLLPLMLAVVVEKMITKGVFNSVAFLPIKKLQQFLGDRMIDVLKFFKVSSIVHSAGEDVFGQAWGLNSPGQDRIATEAVKKVYYTLVRFLFALVTGQFTEDSIFEGVFLTGLAEGLLLMVHDYIALTEPAVVGAISRAKRVDVAGDTLVALQKLSQFDSDIVQRTNELLASFSSIQGGAAVVRGIGGVGGLWEKIKFFNVQLAGEILSTFGKIASRVVSPLYLGSFIASAWQVVLAQPERMCLGPRIAFKIEEEDPALLTCNNFPSLSPSGPQSIISSQAIRPSRTLAASSSTVFPEVTTYNNVATQLLGALTAADVNQVTKLTDSLFKADEKLSAVFDSAQQRLLVAYSQAFSLPGFGPLFRAASDATQTANISRATLLGLVATWLNFKQPQDLDLAKAQVTDAITANQAAADALGPALAAIGGMTLPPLLLVDVAAPETALPGATVKVNVSLTNAGDETANDVKLTLIEDEDLGSGSVELGLSPLAGKRSTNATFLVNIPSWLAATVATVQVVASASNAPSNDVEAAITILEGSELIKTVNCGSQLLQDALGSQLKYGTTVLVSGTCNENLVIAEEQRSLTLDGQGVATIVGPDPTKNSLDVRGRGITLKDFTITGGLNGIHVSGGATALIDSNVIQGAAANGILVDQHSFARIINNKVQNNGGGGVLIDESSSARIGLLSGDDSVASPNTIQGNGGDGVHVTHASIARVVGNTIVNNARSGIGVNRVSYADIAGNFINGNSLDGIFVGGNSGVALGTDTSGTTVTPLDDTNSGENAGVGIICSIGGYATGRTGGLDSGAIAFDATCINSVKP